VYKLNLTLGMLLYCYLIPMSVLHLTSMSTSKLSINLEYKLLDIF